MSVAVVDAETFEAGMKQLRKEEERMGGMQHQLTKLMNDSMHRDYAAGRLTQVQVNTLESASKRVG